MGLDYTIAMEIRRKGENKPLFEVEIAYWRKNWAVSELCQNIARGRWMIGAKGDYETYCTPEVLEDLIHAFGRRLSVDDSLWGNSLWGETISRTQTVRELVSICAAQSFITNPTYDTAEDIQAFFDYKIDIDEVAFYIKNPEAYEVVIVFYNSY